MTPVGFSLDIPVADRLQRVTRFGGWWLEGAAGRGLPLSLAINGVPVAALQRMQRPDVGRALPDVPRAAMAGFLGDLLLPPEFELATPYTAAVTLASPQAALATHFIALMTSPEALPLRGAGGFEN